MAQSFAQLYVHLIFATKKRTPWLQTQDFRNRLYQYMHGICRELKSPAITIGGTEDHVHLLCRMSREITLVNFLRDLKRASSLWIKQQPEGTPIFRWQDGYSAFSASPAHVESLEKYIRTQEEHHRKTSFRDEMIRLLQMYKVDFDDRDL